jgi:formylmethanofuran dehydrogenase subunit D
MLAEKPMSKLNVTLLTGRTLRQGQGKEYGKLSERYWKSVTICEIDPDDMKDLGVKEGQNIKIATDYGSVVVKAVKSLRAPHRSVVFVPYGPWINVVVNPKTHGTGMPSFKGIAATVEPAFEEKVLQLEELLRQHYKKE